MLTGHSRNLHTCLYVDQVSYLFELVLHSSHCCFVKMGHKQGAGLGKEGQGISEPIKAAVRPGRGAVGLYGPEVKGPDVRKSQKELGQDGKDTVTHSASPDFYS